MVEVFTEAPYIEQAEFKREGSYSICWPRDLENYTLIPVEGAGFVVIKQVISLEDEDRDWDSR